MKRPVQQSLIDPTLERPVGPIPRSAVRGNNADLIASVASLYLTGSVLDVTYGRGKWWDRFTPDPFTFHDLADGIDFRALPEDDDSFDAVCFDPPYVPAGGGPMNASCDDFRDRFGLDWGDGYRSVAALAAMVEKGLAECARVTNRWLLVKCMEFVSGGKFHDMPTNVTLWCRDLGLAKHDVIVHAAGSGPGGQNIYEPLRARRSHSYLLVFEKAQ